MYIYVHLHLSTYIYTYAFREGSKKRMKKGRETHRKRDVHLCNTHIYMTPTQDTKVYPWVTYGVASTSRLLKIIGLFCKRAL